MPGAVLSQTGAPYPESLDTTRFDGGLVAQTPVAERYVLTARVSATRKDEDYLRGEGRERDVQDTFFTELALRGTAPRQTWVGGVAFEQSTLDPRDQPRFAYRHNVPGVFLQDDIDVQRWLTLSVSGRVDFHNVFGTFVSPRVSALLRSGAWTSRLSIGSGFFAPTALTEETEAAGLARLTIDTPLGAGRGQSGTFDLTRVQGPLTLTATFFRYEVHGPAVVDRATYTLSTLAESTLNTGLDTVATIRRAPFSLTGTYTYVRSQEGVGADRGDIPLTPRQRWNRRHVGEGAARKDRCRSVLHGCAAARGQSVPLAERTVRAVRWIDRAPLWSRPALRQRRESRRRSSDSIRSASATVSGGGRSMDRRRLGAT